MKFGRAKADWYEIQTAVRKLRQQMRGENKIYDGSMRQEWYHTNVYTSDTKLLDDLLQDDHMMRYLTDMRYTSEEYELEMNKLEGIPTDIKLVRQKKPGYEYRIYLRSTTMDADLKESVKNLKNIIEANKKNVHIVPYLLDRMSSGHLYTSEHNFYCDDPDVIMMMYLGAPGAIRKVYKIVERD